MRSLKVLYALTGILWAGYWSENLIAAHLTDHIPFSTGSFECLMLFVSIPAIGYVLLFKVLPLTGRLLRR
jgi:hypothetical protein